MTEKEQLVILNLVRGLGPVRIKKLIETFGSAGKVLSQSPSSLQRVPGIGPALSSVVSDWKNLEYKEEFRLIEKLGIRITTIYEPGYPPALKEIYDPPPVLYIRGEIRREDRPAIGVVGSRRASTYGLEAARRLSRELSAEGFTVVSGLARGIDTRAHRGALEGGGRTIAVLGSGLGTIYPPENRGLADAIAGRGAVISEFPVRMPPERTNFPLRNRIISGLSLGVLVVEAASRSGALITARLAMEQGRLVMAVPGRIDSFSARGTNDLIGDGARMVRSVDDILDEFAYLLPEKKPETLPPGTSPRGLSPDQERVYRVLAEEEKRVDEIISRTGLSSGAVASILLSLELKKLVKRLPGKTYIKT